jgi:hypothetical protein
LQVLIDKLYIQQYKIDVELRTQQILSNKLVIAYQGIPACRFAIANPLDDVLTLINRLQSSINAWEKENPNQSIFLTAAELRRLHRCFGHPSIERLQKLLDRSGHEIDKLAIEYLTKFCHHCQIHSKSLGRFRFILRDDVEFNYSIIVDVMYISGNPILHIIDEATRFQAGRWL